MAVAAGRPIERDPVVEDGVDVAFFHAGDLFVKHSDGCKPVFEGCSGEWDVVRLAELLYTEEGGAMEFLNARKLGFVEHGHFHAASPAPEHLHDGSMRETRLFVREPGVVGAERPGVAFGVLDGELAGAVVSAL